MKKSLFLRLFFLSIIPSALLIFSCRLGLEPSWKQGATSIVISLGESTQNDERALISDQGYVLIKAAGKGYGPYYVGSSKKITITDIPSGVYQDFGLLFTSKEVNFSELKQLISQSTNINDIDDWLLTHLDGLVSVGPQFNQPVIIKENRVNNLSFTLVPMLSNQYVLIPIKALQS